MAYALIASTSKASTGSGNAVTTDPIDTTGATLITVTVTHLLGGLGALTDNVSNSYGAVVLSTDQPNEAIEWYVKESPTTNAGHTFTIGAAANSYQTIFVHAWSGSAASALDQTNEAVNGSNATSIQPGSVTPTEDNELVMTAVAWSNSSGGASVSDSFATPLAIDTATTNIPGAVSYKIQTSAVAVNPTWSWPNSVRPVSNILTFKAGAVGDLSVSLSEAQIGGSVF